MKQLRILFKFYINASIHVALAVLALVGVTVLQFGLEVRAFFWLFLFCGTITGYNFVKYAKIAGLHHRSLTNSLRSIQVFSLFNFAGLLASSFFLSPQTLLLMAFLGLLTFFYAVPFLRKKNLRTFSGVKIFVVALVWSGITVFGPMAEVGMVWTIDCWIAFFQRFLLVFVWTLPFEIRDLRYDVKKLKTIPQLLGVSATKGIGIVVLVGVILLDGLTQGLLFSTHYALVFVAVVSGFALVLSQKKQSQYFASFWVEGIPIIWFVSLVLLRHFLA